MLIGYARVSTDHQEAAAQVTALKAAGCKRIYQEKASGGRTDRRELQKLLTQIQNGDVLVVWKLDRLSRSLRDILEIMERLNKANVRFRSLTEAVDTTTPAGRMMLHIVSSFAEYERAVLHEGTRSGLQLARQSGRIRGTSAQTDDFSTTEADTHGIPRKKFGGRRLLSQSSASRSETQGYQGPAACLNPCAAGGFRF